MFCSILLIRSVAPLTYGITAVATGAGHVFQYCDVLLWLTNVTGRQTLTRDPSGSLDYTSDSTRGNLYSEAYSML